MLVGHLYSLSTGSCDYTGLSMNRVKHILSWFSQVWHNREMSWQGKQTHPSPSWQTCILPEEDRCHHLQTNPPLQRQRPKPLSYH